MCEIKVITIITEVWESANLYTICQTSSYKIRSNTFTYYLRVVLNIFLIEHDILRRYTYLQNDVILELTSVNFYI